MQDRICFQCDKEISGGATKQRKEKTIYFCSGECLDNYEKHTKVSEEMS